MLNVESGAKQNWRTILELNHTFPLKGKTRLLWKTVKPVFHFTILLAAGENFSPKIYNTIQYNTIKFI